MQAPIAAQPDSSVTFVLAGFVPALLLQDEDVAKVRFSRMALESNTAVFEKHVDLDTDLSDAISWIGARCSREVRVERERVMSDIERIGSLMRKRGDLEDWCRMLHDNLRVHMFWCLY